jgi:GT2 family glycosyltransferase
MKSIIHNGLGGGWRNLSGTTPLRHKPRKWRYSEWRQYKDISRQIEKNKVCRLAEARPSPVSIITLAENDLSRVARNLDFPTTNRPIVSIIVPVFNHVRLTLECLTSIQRFTNCLVPYEVVVANDASTDATATLLPLVKNAIYLRNDENLGFIRNCNHAVEHARGQFVLFLNNDVQVTAGWLPALTYAFRNLPKVGAVGPRMIYPSGHLQEAGVVINSDCQTEFIGHNDDPALPRYAFARRVDYCSGACLMLERARFIGLGGFNDELAPAYYEDVDLCLRLRRQGLDVWYVPDSVVVHHRNKTSNSLASNYAIHWGRRNRDKIARLWQADIDALNRVRLFAFYSVHVFAIPRSDRWWHNVFRRPTDTARARPSGSAGFSDPLKTFAQQAALAKHSGIEGFCFHYNWSARERGSGQLLEAMLSGNGPDFPFLLCWSSDVGTACEDRLEREMTNSPEQSDVDDAAAINELMRFFRDRRYVRIDGKPLLLVHRADAIREFARSAATWRAACRKEGIGEIYLALVDCVGQRDSPEMFGCDATVQVPPLQEASYIAGRASNVAFESTRADFETSLLNTLHKPLPPAPCFPVVISNWHALIHAADPAMHFKGASPGSFQALLDAAIRRTREHNFGEERIVFIDV